MDRIFVYSFTILSIISCKKNEENIYELNPDKEFILSKKKMEIQLKYFQNLFASTIQNLNF